MKLLLAFLFFTSFCLRAEVKTDPQKVTMELELLLKSYDRMIDPELEAKELQQFKEMIKKINSVITSIPTGALIFGSKSLIYQSLMKKQWQQFSKQTQISKEDIEKFRQKREKIKARLTPLTQHALSLLEDDLDIMLKDRNFKLVASLKAKSTELATLRTSIKLLAPWVHAVIQLGPEALENELKECYLKALHHFIAYGHSFQYAANRKGPALAEGGPPPIVWSASTPTPKKEKTQKGPTLKTPPKLKDRQKKAKKEAQKLVEKLDLTPTPTPVPAEERTSSGWTPSD